MEKFRVNLKEINGVLMIPVPENLDLLMGWDDGDLLEVAFHEINKIPVKKEWIAAPEETGKKKVTLLSKKYGNKIITQDAVIELLEKPTPDMSIYRSTYVKWKGKKYGVKNICKILFGFDDFNTYTGENVLKKLGFPTFKK